MDLVRQGCPPALVAKLAEPLPQTGLSSPPLGSPKCSVCPDVFLGRASRGISAGCPLSTLPPSLPAVSCERRSSQVPWDRAATVAGPLHPAPAAPLTASCQAILPFLPLQLKHRLFMEEDPIFSARRAISYSLTGPRAHVGCTVGLQRVPSAVSPPSW